MVTILLRTILIYACLITTMRLMGKRQIGELEVTDLVTTFLLSEIASLPIADRDVPVVHALIPMITLLTLEVLSSYILLRVPRLKSLLSARPTVLIDKGKLDQRALRETRVSVDELMSEVRNHGLTSLSQIECAILEKNGKLTVLPKPQFAQPSCEQLGITACSEPLMHIVYVANTYSDTGLRLIGKDRAWLECQFAKRSIDKERLYCATANEGGDLWWVYRTEADKS